MTSFLDYLETGSHSGPFMGGAVGPQFLTWDQRDFRAQRRQYGEGELDAGSFSLSQVHFDKETGTASVGQLDVGPSGWYGTAPTHERKGCDCPQGGSCNCA